MRMHHVVKRDRFSFAISGGIKFNFSGRSLISFLHESEYDRFYVGATLAGQIFNLFRQVQRRIIEGWAL